MHSLSTAVHSGARTPRSAFCARSANVVRAPSSGCRWPLVCSPRRAFRGPPRPLPCRCCLRPRRSRRAARVRRRASPILAPRARRVAARRERRDVAPVARAAPRSASSTATALVARGARGDPRRGSPTTSAGCCRPAPARSSGRRSRVELVARRRAAPPVRPARRRAPRRPTRSTRATRSTSSSSATPTASPTRPPSPSPSCPASPTTRSTSAGRPGSARRISSTPSRTTCADCGDTTVRYTTAEAFTNHFLAALHGRDTDAFKAAYRDVDVLLVDDVQFLEAKARTEQEFFHTFNALHQGGAQIVLTSDRPPRDMTALEDRLRERFEAGLLCDVAAPDRTTRLTILRKRVQQDEIDGVEPAALEAIADRVTDNVRALEGALIRVVAFALAHRPADHRRARRGGPRRPLPRAASPPGRASGPSRSRPPRPSALSARGAAVRQPLRRRRVAAPGRDVPRA